MDRGTDRPLFVFAPPKVGNTTMIFALQRLGLEVERAHHISDSFFWQSLARLQIDADEAKVQEFLDWNENFRKSAVANFDGRGCSIVSLVRDPVARTVSYLFDTTSMREPSVRRDWKAGKLTVESLIRRFLDREDHFHALDWFDREIHGPFGIDVFADPFPRADGYRIYRHGNTALLLLRLEDLSRCGQAALREFIGIDSIDLRRANVRAESDTSELYDLFREKLRLPRSYLDRMYGSRLARHFYSPEEIAAFRKRWPAMEENS